MILVDTGAWSALSGPVDPDYLAASSFRDSNNEPLISTDYIVDELLTLFRMRRQSHCATEWLERVLAADGTGLVRVTPVDFERAIDIDRSYADKYWNFTDCTSPAVMERLNVAKAFSLDEHFRQFGSIAIVP